MLNDQSNWILLENDTSCEKGAREVVVVRLNVDISKRTKLLSF